MAKLGYQNSNTSKPIVTKFGMGDYVGYMTTHAKISFKAIAPVEASQQIMKYHSNVVFTFISILLPVRH